MNDGEVCMLGHNVCIVLDITKVTQSQDLSHFQSAAAVPIMGMSRQSITMGR